MKSNSTFCGGEPAWANACVGRNGNPGYMDYARGFSSAANTLLNHVIDNEEIDVVDEFVYPICFNMRHSIELRLKHAISRLNKLAQYRRRAETKNISKTHDITDIWNSVKTLCAEDSRLEPFSKRLDEFISDIAEIDRTGQTFRYPADTENKKHLAETGVVNLCTLKKRFEILEISMEYFSSLIEALLYEYAQGSFTKKLSRHQIIKIAEELPDRELWVNSTFSEQKEKLKSKYGISSSELSRAINFIQNNHEMAPLIGTSCGLRHLEMEDLQAFFDAWCQLHDINRLKRSQELIFDPTSNEATGSFLDGLVQTAVIRKNIWSDFKDKMTPQKVADIEAIFYLSRDGYKYSEEYALCVDRHLAKIKGDDDRQRDLFHILDKTNAFDKILRTLYFLRQNEMADYFITRYGLEGHYVWVPLAREGRLFVDPCFAIAVRYNEVIQKAVANDGVISSINPATNHPTDHAA